MLLAVTVSLGTMLHIMMSKLVAASTFIRTQICDYNWYAVLSDNVGPELNNITCKPYNRYGAQCQHCMDGYGPAAFSDSATCADCSRHKYLWLLNLAFQLMSLN